VAVLVATLSPQLSRECREGPGGPEARRLLLVFTLALRPSPGGRLSMLRVIPLIGLMVVAKLDTCTGGCGLLFTYFAATRAPLGLLPA
jgi:hypothetical protein